MAHNSDPLARVEYGASAPSFEVAPGRTAFVIVDVQYYDASRDHGMGRAARERGTLAELEYLFDHVDLIIPRIQRLQAASRRRGIEVIFIRIGALTRDGRDAAAARDRPPGAQPPYWQDKDAQILDEIAPIGDELVFSKTTGSAFTSTSLDYVLRQIGIENLFMCGVVTSGCVQRTARDADDLGYNVILVGDACAASSPELHRNAIEAMDQRRIRVLSTDAAVALIETAIPGPAKELAAIS
jgi:nicotinamidase-related amidase